MKFSMNEVLTAMRAKGLHDEVAAVGIVLQQRAELLEALKMVQEAAFDMRGEDFNLTTEQWSIFHAAIANTEK